MWAWGSNATGRSREIRAYTFLDKFNKSQLYRRSGCGDSPGHLLVQASLALFCTCSQDNCDLSHLEESAERGELVEEESLHLTSVQVPFVCDTTFPGKTWRWCALTSPAATSTPPFGSPSPAISSSDLQARQQQFRLSSLTQPCVDEGSELEAKFPRHCPTSPFVSGTSRWLGRDLFLALDNP